MGFSIFYSWQSDAPDKCNRRFIREALNDAVAAIGQNTEIVDSPRVDAGMEGVPGTQDVARMMFEKIDRSDMFLADVTLVGKIKPLKEGGKRKRTPNPNVMTEMGYAAARMGWERVICVMNEYYGCREDLPFDIESKRHPIDFTLDPATMAEHKGIKKELTKWIRTAIETCTAAHHEGVKEAISRLDILCLLVCSVYRRVPYFRDLGQDEQNRVALVNVIDLEGFRAAVMRLLDLRLLFTETHSGLYSYKWSHRGKLLLDELARLNQLQPVQEAIDQPNPH